MVLPGLSHQRRFRGFCIVVEEREDAVRHQALRHCREVPRELSLALLLEGLETINLVQQLLWR